MDVTRNRLSIVSFLLIGLLTPLAIAYSGGSGTPSDPYQIATAADLIALGNEPNDYTKCFILTADIDLDPNLPGGKVFDKAVIAADANDTKEGFQGTCFTGTFDGNAYKILHLTMTGQDYLGLFGQLGWDAPGGEVKDLGVVDVNVIGTGSYVGGLVGINYGTLAQCYSTAMVSAMCHSIGGLVGVNYGTVTQCYSTGAVSGGCHVGGLVGLNYGGTVTHCYTKGVVAGEYTVGGLVGINYGTLAQCYSTAMVSATDRSVGGLVGVNYSTVTQCYSTGTVSGRYCVGGLVGLNYRGTVTHCYTKGAVAGEYAVGGLVGGNVFDSAGGDIIESYSTGTITGKGEVGGLVGGNMGTLTQCYSTAMVSATGQSVGGLVGLNYETVTQCYSTGSVSGDGNDVGGLVGVNWGGVTGCFWDTQTSGQAMSAGGTGKTTVEMQTAETFHDAGWDFVGETANGTEAVWWINEGKDYPRLNWQGPAGMVFVDIPDDTFQMGDPDHVGESDERPVHTVTLSGFQMSSCETTNAQYAAFLNAALAGGLIKVVSGVVYPSSDNTRSLSYFDTHGANSSSQIEYSQGQFTVLSRDGKAMADHPVIRVSWYGAKAFCDYYGCRLPTEAEWEYAARGGYHDPYYRYPWGSNAIDCSKANYRNGTNSYCNPSNLTSDPYTAPVGYYGPQGAYGLCDMSGNVWEWCQDWYDSGYYSGSPSSNPAGPDAGTYHVLRGGSWNNGDSNCRSTVRNRSNPGYRGNYYGFRVCR